MLFVREAGLAPRVALDCRLLDWPGVGRYCIELANALVTTAPDLRFFWLCAARDCDKLPTAPNASPLVVGARPFSIAEQITVPYVLRRHSIDLLHAPTPTTLPVLAPRLVVTAHDLTYKRFPEFLPNPLGRAYYNAMTRLSVARARRIIAVSEFTRADLLAYWPQIAPRTVAILNGVSEAFVRTPSPAEIAHWRAEVALPERYLLYIGTRKRHKNLLRLIEAYGALDAAQRDRFPLIMVAPPDPRYPEVDATVRRLGIERHVLWRAGVPEAALPVLYRLAHCVVVPSIYEGFGLPVAEAYACGTPAVVARAGALPEIGGNACVLVDPCDVGSIRTALARLIEDAVLHSKLKERTRQEAARFDWNKSARHVAQVYREALQ